jgi:hypothetical protein
MTEVKSFRFTGGAAAELGLKKRTRKAKGGNEEQADPTFKNAQIIKVEEVTGGAAALLPTSTPAAVALRPELQVTTPTIPPATPTTALLQGGAKQIKVELKKKILSKKVTLNPKREVAKPKPHTKKARKFVLGVSSLHKRMTRAKKVHHTVKKMPLDVLRKHLIQSKLIKESSKAPEAILRQIAADSELVGKKVL